VAKKNDRQTTPYFLQCLRVCGVFQMKDPSKMSIDELKANSSYDPTEKGKLLKLSKSSFMTYSKCARQFWWQKVLLKDMRMPATPEMERGTRIHTALETIYDNWEGQSTLAPLIPIEAHEAGVDELVNLEQQRIELWGIDKFKPVEYEEYRAVYDAERDVVLVGLIDAILEHPDGGLCIYELKTGNMNDGKLSRTRRELCYYAHMLRLMGEKRPITHFAYIAPDADNLDFVMKMVNDNKRQVLLGEEKGILIVEKVNGRSDKAFIKALDKAVEGLKAHENPMSWSDYFCPQWCDFSPQCENELTGVDSEW